ncbi:transposase [Coleofasciculus sp. FACHB-64]|uniref:transposase n=1 Tax=Cyanophyceae TaxID=3028117 RepID=UPI001683BFE4|nr:MULTISPECIES: transposase [unclassified Coleofasciculus]MBD1839067.1 transposase [Coleofasciculus sp. FACHB-501]MBD2048738.1 transposase [Coleofasciculus sp. FACHB-64]
MMLSSFPKIVKSLLKRLSPSDYPVLNSRLLFEIWLTFVLDASLTSMRDLFYRLNHAGIEVDISTFSKACKTRQGENFCRIYMELIERLKQQHPATAQMLIPIDSTVISLTSKLFWEQEYHQVKLLNGINLTQGNPTECLIHFGQGHDARFAETVNSMIPENGVGVMDRGCASWEFLLELSVTQTRFVVRIKNNMKTEFDHDRYRVVWFCDLENRSEFRLATNLEQLTNEEIGEIYRNRWQIEILWKFLKMHLKLDCLISKNLNGVTMKIYMVLIAYLILELMEIPAFYEQRLLDKFRYLQLELSRRCSIVHWSYDLLLNTLV